MKKKIYKTVISYTILSDTPYSSNSLEGISTDCEYGDCIGGNFITTVENKELSGKRAVEEIQKLGSDPEFFQMDGSGNDISEVDVDDDSPDDDEE
jgi:hypothetical protein